MIINLWCVVLKICQICLNDHNHIKIWYNNMSLVHVHIHYIMHEPIVSEMWEEEYEAPIQTIEMSSFPTCHGNVYHI